VTRIQAVTCTRLRVSLHTPFVTALRRTGSTDTVVVRIADSDGNTGWGEAPQVWQVTGESLAGATACVEEMLAPLAVGRDVDDWPEVAAAVQRAVARNFGAKAAVDVALHDLAARRAGVPFARFLRDRDGAPNERLPRAEWASFADTSATDRTADTGNTGDTRGTDIAEAADTAGTIPRLVATDVTLSVGSAAELAPTAQQRVAEGFTTLKMKVGTDAATDVARVRAVRDAVGPDVTIRLDANQGWSPQEAVEVIHALEAADLGVEVVEQPVAGDDVEGLAWVRSRVELPVMADESVYGMRDLDRILRLEAADMINVKLAKCGSLDVARDLLRKAADHGLGTIVGSMMETHIGVGAAASLVAAYPTTLTSDLDAAWWTVNSAVVGGLRYVGSTVTLPSGPGLGSVGLACVRGP
jgi:L-alanine-DL-glutamate epimerase-like enolase superfamily enzyme